MTKSTKRPRDLNQWAKRMVDIATGDIEDRNQIAAPDPNKDPAAVSLGRKGGFVQPRLYQASAAAGFHDITQGNNGAYTAGPGWDPCTGLGSPDGAALLTALG